MVRSAAVSTLMRLWLPGDLAAAGEEPEGGTVAPAGAAELNGAATVIITAAAIVTRALLLPVAFKTSPVGIAWGVRNRLTSAFPA